MYTPPPAETNNNPGKVTLLDASKAPQLPSSGKLVPVYVATQIPHGVLSAGSPLAFSPDPEGSVFVTFVSDVNTRAAMRGVYQAAANISLPGKFTPSNPDDYGSKVPLAAVHGTLLSEKVSN